MAEPSGGTRGVDLVEAFGRLQALTLEAPQVGEFLSALAALAPQLGGPPIAGSVTIRGERDPYTVAADDVFAADADEAQYDRGEGPCLEALRTGRTVHVTDMRSETRWERYRPHAVSVGVRSVLSLPLPVGGATVGGLNLYARSPDAFDDQAREHLTVFAAQAAAALAMVLRNVRQDRLSSQLEQALASRTTIDQALGILMAQQRCTADEAFALLRMHSQNSNRKVRDVAAQLIERVSGEPPKPGAAFTA